MTKPRLLLMAGNSPQEFAALLGKSRGRLSENRERGRNQARMRTFAAGAPNQDRVAGMIAIQEARWGWAWSAAL